MGEKNKRCQCFDFARSKRLLIALVAVVADSGIPRWACSTLSSLLAIPPAPRVLAAIADNVSHAFIAWSVVRAFPSKPRVVPTSQSWLVYREQFVGWCLGSLLDLDHFVSARSLSLSAATHLSHRPLGHAVPVALAAAFATGALFRSRRAGAVVAAAFMSHQLRDATRRGLWWCTPCVRTAASAYWSIDYSTPPIPYWLYICILLLLPSLGCVENNGNRIYISGRSPKLIVGEKKEAGLQGKAEPKARRDFWCDEGYAV